MEQQQHEDLNSQEYQFFRRAQERDQGALAVLYERYFDRIYRYCLARIGNVNEAEDLTEEVFLRMLKAIDSFKWQPNGFEPWLFRIAHNLLVDSLRKKTYQITYLPILAGSVLNYPSFEEKLDQKWDEEELAQAVGQLTVAQRDVITLRFAAGLSLAETAEILGKQVGNVKVLQHNALIALRRLLIEAHAREEELWKREKQSYLNAALTES